MRGRHPSEGHESRNKHQYSVADRSGEPPLRLVGGRFSEAARAKIWRLECDPGLSRLLREGLRWADKPPGWR